MIIHYSSSSSSFFFLFFFFLPFFFLFFPLTAATVFKMKDLRAKNLEPFRKGTWYSAGVPLQRSPTWGGARLQPQRLVCLAPHARLSQQWVYLIKTKSNIFSCFQFFYKICTQFDAQIKVLRTDNGTEYIDNQFSAYVESNVILYQTSCPYISAKLVLLKGKG